MEKTFIVNKSILYENIFCDIIEELTTLAQKKEIPAWESYEVEMTEKIYPLTKHRLNLHANSVEKPGPVVAIVYVSYNNNENRAEFTVSWLE